MDGKGTTRLLLTLLRGEKPFVVGWLCAMLAASLATLSVPIALGMVIDQGFGTNRATDMVFLGLGGIALLLAMTTAARLFFVSQLGDRVVANMRKGLFRQLLDRDMDFHHACRSSDLVARLGLDAEYLRTLVGVALSNALRNALTLAGTTAMMFWTSPKLALIALFAVPVAVLPIFSANRKQRNLVRQTMDQMAKATAIASESLAAVRAVKEYVREEHEHQRYGDAIDATSLLARRKVVAQSILAVMAISLVFAAVTAVLWLGALDVRAGRLSPGALGQFVLYAVLGGMAVTEFLQTWGLLQRSAGAVGRIADVFETDPPRVSRGLSMRGGLPGAPEIWFDGVVYAYATDPNTAVLQDVSLVAEAGKCTAIVGPSGAGKSTLFALLMGLYRPSVGTISLNGIDIASLDVAVLRNSVAIVPQLPAIFATTVRENIRFGRLQATDEEVEQAARAANAEEFIAALPSGYDEQLGERGTRLSGGQLQRIAIARAVLKNAPVLLLDEAMSSLDAANEHAINTALRHLMRGRTTMVIAHRLSTIVDADKIVVMNAGRVESSGTHAGLVASGGLYADFSRLQSIGIASGNAVAAMLKQ